MNVHLIHFRFYLLYYSLDFTYRFAEPYLVCFHIFDPWRRGRSKLSYSCEFISGFFLVSIYGGNFISYIIEDRTTLACYCPIFFTCNLSYTKIKPYLLLILKGCPFWLIFCVINNYLHIHFPFLMFWEKNYISSSDLL